MVNSAAHKVRLEKYLPLVYTLRAVDSIMLYTNIAVGVKV